MLQRPLVLMQPKSLLRLPQAASRLADLTTGTFRPVIDAALVGAAAGTAGGESASRRLRTRMTLRSELAMADGERAKAEELLLKVINLEPANPEALTMAAVTFVSVRKTPARIRGENGFTYHPIAEVAILFAGIFATMIPALAILNFRGSELGLSEQGGVCRTKANCLRICARGPIAVFGASAR